MDKNYAKFTDLKYGPHDFPGGPLPYIRVDQDISVFKAHSNIVNTLAFALSLSDEGNYVKSLNFINYGNTQLVYLAKDKYDNDFTVLINQPHTPLGIVKSEFQNLERLAKLDNRFIVKPQKYFLIESWGHELYTTDYIPNALCVAYFHNVNSLHGFYNPLPSYHFEEFNDSISRVINSAMISLLVNYYDEESGLGIAKTQISGNDFVLTRDYINGDITTVEKSIRLISARDSINISLENYCDLLTKEFSEGTTRDDPRVINGIFKVNHKSVKPMSEKEVSLGILRGLELRDSRKIF